jgi:hypothetical protein
MTKLKISTTEELTWQARAVEQLSRLFDEDPDTRAFVLSGSLAAPEVQEDVWSDVDAKIILADHAVDRYALSTAWLAPFGRLIGAERHASRVTKTLRVCLEGFQRFDLTFIPESAWAGPSSWERNPFHPADVVVWSRLADLATRLAALPLPTEYQDLPREEIEKMVDAFWFKAALAIAKVARNDLLIGLHLALDLARDGLVLQMIRRDRAKRTTIHRLGGWGNEIVARFTWNGQASSEEEILDFIRVSGEIFDELASTLLPGYDQRGLLLFPSLEAARQFVHNTPSSAPQKSKDHHD